ncbi:MAG: hypothetical protein Q7U13_06205, partial [Rhodoferax sp.]|nr:hypothetical protein [Rhodoferax sp.]
MSQRSEPAASSHSASSSQRPASSQAGSGAARAVATMVDGAGVAAGLQRFGQVVRHARVQATLAVFAQRRGGDADQHRREVALLCPDGLRGGLAVHAGHVAVEQHQGKRLLRGLRAGEGLQRCGAIADAV